MSNEVDRIRVFRKLAADYFRWWHIEGLRAQRIDPAKPAPDPRDVLEPQEKRMKAKAELVQIGPGLAEDLEAREEDSSRLLLFLRIIGTVGGGGPKAADQIWPAIDVQLQRAAIRLGNRRTVGFKPQSPKERKAKWMANAMLLVRDHPDWSDAKIAKQVGIDPSRLSGKRCPEYQRAALLARQRRLPKGVISIDPDTHERTLEAIAPDDAD